MYAKVENGLKNNDLNSSLEECLRGRFYHLGVLLGKIEGGDDEEFYRLMSSLVERQKNGEDDQKRIVEKIVETGKEKEIKVKLLCNWATSEELAKLWNKMSKGDFTWDNVRLVWNEEPDYFVVINKPPENENPPLEKTILFRMEPKMENHPEKWGKWADIDPSSLFWAGHHHLTYNNNEWHLSRTYSQLRDYTCVKNPEFDRVISTVLSEKYHDPGHIKRIDFVKFLERKGVSVHVYGSNKWEYQNYKGELPYHAKDNAIFPYKYTFNVENHSIKNYYTEKVIDGILGECLVFYSGCYNLQEFLPADSFVYLELSNFEQDFQTIQRAIAENWWEKRLSSIREARRIILEERQFFPRLKKILENQASNHSE